MASVLRYSFGIVSKQQTHIYEIHNTYVYLKLLIYYFEQLIFQIPFMFYFSTYTLVCIHVVQLTGFSQLVRFWLGLRDAVFARVSPGLRVLATSANTLPRAAIVVRTQHGL